MPPPHREWLLVEGDTADDPGKMRLDIVLIVLISHFFFFLIRQIHGTFV
jgi:hypothetical protein